jgi:predicted DNA-binding transcriptional regulator AlpA
MHGGNQAKPAQSPELLTLKEAAALCSVSERTLWGWAQSGAAPPPLRIGRGTVRYSRPEYIQWIASGCRPVEGGRNNEQ